MQERTGTAVRLRYRLAKFNTDHPTVLAALLAVVLAVWTYSPMLRHLRTVTSSDRDAPLFVWSLGHTPWRIVHGHNPFFTTSIFATTGGANLAFNAVAPGLGVLMAPVTALFGPVVGFNALTVITPIVNTLAARRLLRIVTATNGFSVTVGALLIGFAPLVLMHNAARFQIAFQALVLLLLAELWRAAAAWLDGRTVPWRWLVAAGVLAGLQTWIGSEMLAISLVIAVIALVVALGLGAASRSLRIGRPTRHDLLALLAGLASAIVAALPFLLTYLFGSERYTGHYHAAARHLFGLRIANALTPTDVLLVHAHVPLAIARSALSVLPDEDTGYVSIAGLVVLLLVAVTWRRRSSLQRGALIVAAVSGLLALGPTIRWKGVGAGLAGPWRLVENVPFLREVVANRFSFGIVLALAVVVATVGPSMLGTRHRLDGVMLAACVLLPLLMLPARFNRAQVVSESADALLKSSCRDVLAVTVPRELEQDGMAWQSRADFAFDMYRGFAFRESSDPKGDPIRLDDIALNGWNGDDAVAAAAVGELQQLGIGCVVTPSTNPTVIGNVSAVLGQPLIAGDVAVWTEPFGGSDQ